MDNIPTPVREITVPLFAGRSRSDLPRWIARYKAQCEAAGRDPTKTFPLYCDEVVFQRLIQEKAVFKEGMWKQLEDILMKLYGAPVETLQLTTELFARMQKVDEPVSDFARALSTLASPLNWSDTQLLSLFMSNMLPDLLGKLGAQPLPSFQAAEEAAIRTEARAKGSRNVHQSTVTSVTPSFRSTPYERPLAGGQDPCSVCRTKKHTNIDCWKQHPELKPAYHVNRPYSQRPSKSASGVTSEREGTAGCQVCKRLGHTALECYKLKAAIKTGDRSKLVTAVVSEVQVTKQSANPIFVTATLVDGTTVQALIDPGSAITLARATLIQHLHGKSILPSTAETFLSANTSTLEPTEIRSATVKIGSINVVMTIKIVTELSVPFIIGMDTLSALRALVDCASRTILIGDNREQVQGTTVTCDASPNTAFAVVHSSNDSDPMVVVTDAALRSFVMAVVHQMDSSDTNPIHLVSNGLPEEGSNVTGVAQVGPLLAETEPTIAKTLNSKQHHAISQLLVQCKLLFQPLKPGQLARISPMTIETGESAPITGRPYRLAHTERSYVDEQVQKYLERGWIVPSNSPWCSPVLLVSKPGVDENGNPNRRFCIDLRNLNEVTKPDSYPAQNIQDLFDQLEGCIIFTTLDLEAAYHQCPINEQDQAKTAFATDKGLFEFKVVPFGLRNAPAHFQRAISQSLNGVKGVVAYLDDILIFSQSWDQHLETITEVFKRLSETGFRLKLTKCIFGASSVPFLGHVIGNAGIKMQPDKIDAIKAINTPTDTVSLRRFLGMTVYYSRFIHNYSIMAAPLYNLLKKNQIWRWTDKEDASFKKLIDEFGSEKLLSFPDFDKPFRLSCDASGLGCGAVLEQDSGMEHWKPIAFFSRKFNKAEINYIVEEQECLAIVEAVKKFRYYLFGRHFAVRTDHRALLWIQSSRNHSPRINRWVLVLQEYDFSIEHVAGDLNVVADTLSRDSNICAMVTLLSSEWLDKTRWIEAQAADEFCNRTISSLAKSSETEDDIKFTMFNDLLFLKDQQLRLVVPESMIDIVLQHTHNDAVSGHQGVNRTLSRTFEQFFWPGWRKSTSSFVNKCESCLKTKAVPANLPPSGKLLSYACKDLMAMDIMGPLPATLHGNTVILVIADHFSRFMITIALPNQRAETIAQALLDHLIGKYGPPNRLLSDNGSNFRSTLLVDVCELLNVKKVWTTPYHPQGDGVVERFNQTLQNMISHYVSANQIDWDQYIGLVTFAYNSTVSPVTKFSPHELFLREKPPMITDYLKKMDTTPASRFGELAREALSVAYQSIIRNQDQQAKEIQAEIKSDETQQTTKFFRGDLVFVRNHATPSGLSSKLAKKWLGPYVILKKINDRAFVVQSRVLGDKYRVKRVSVHHLLLHKRETRSTASTIPQTDNGTSAPDTQGDIGLSTTSQSNQPITSTTSTPQQPKKKLPKRRAEETAEAQPPVRRSKVSDRLLKVPSRFLHTPSATGGRNVAYK